MEPSRLNSLVYLYLAKVTPEIAQEFRSSNVCFPSLVDTNLEAITRQYKEAVMADTLVHSHLEKVSPKLASRMKLKRLPKPFPIKLGKVFKKYKKARKKSTDELKTRIKSMHSNSKEVFLSEVYKYPVKVDRNSQLGKVCEYALKQWIPVGKLNYVFPNCRRPYPEERELLLKRFPDLRLGRFTEEEDQSIVRQLDVLTNSGLVTDVDGLVQEICDLLRSFEQISARNILGLYVGRELSNTRLAFDLCDRLSNLVVAYSVRKRKLVRELGTKVLKAEIECRTNDGRNSSRRTWTLGENEELTMEVMKFSGYRPVGEISDQNIDWTKMADKLQRKPQMVREHWSKILKPILATALTGDGVQHVDFKIKLIEAILASKAKSRKEIDWKGLEKQFSPRSSLALQAAYHALAYNLNKSTDMKGGLEIILDKLEHMARNQVRRQVNAKSTKKEREREAIQELYLTLLSNKREA